MVNKINIFKIIFLFAVLFIWEISAYAEELLKLIPQDAMTVLVLENRKEDAGLNYIKEVLKEKLTQENEESKRKAIEDLFQMFDVDKVASAGFYSTIKPLFLLIVEAKGANLLKSITNKIDILFDNSKQIWQEKYLDYRVVYNPHRYNDAENKDLSCYAVVNNYIIIANDNTILKKSIDTFLGNKPSIENSKDFIQDFLKSKKNSDVIIYITNRNKELTNSINSWKKEMGFILFTSADLLESVWVYFDLIDKDNISGKIVFNALSDDPEAKIFNDAQYLVEAMRRKFIAENLNYDTKIDTLDKEVILNLKISNISSFLRKLILSKDTETSIDVKIESVSKSSYIKK